MPAIVAIVVSRRLLLPLVMLDVVVRLVRDLSPGADKGAREGGGAKVLGVLGSPIEPPVSFSGVTPEPESGSLRGELVESVAMLPSED